MNQSPGETPLNPDEILIHCALRFDGYKYKEASGFQARPALDRYLETGKWDLSIFEKMAVFFSLQRGLYKWGLERTEQDHPYRVAFRELFFELARLPVPPDYELSGWIEKWHDRYADRVDECIACVQKVHDKFPLQDSNDED